MNKKILWLTTGGTIDAKPYAGDPPKDVVARNPSGIPNDLKSIGLADSCEFIEICHQDSKHITTGQLDQIADEIEAHPEYMDIRISMGTDDLTKCQSLLERKMEERNITGKTVIFVAAMEPLSNNSPHAWQTLRVAVESAGQHPPGFYLIGDDRSEVQAMKIEVVEGNLYLHKHWPTRTFQYTQEPFSR